MKLARARDTSRHRVYRDVHLCPSDCNLDEPWHTQELPAPVRLPPVATLASVAPYQVCHLTLDEVKQRVLSNNRVLVLARLNIDSKHHAAAAATKDYLPKILGNVTYFHFDNPLGTVLTTRGTILPATVPVNVLNQNTALSTALVAQPITKLIAVNAAVQASRATKASPKPNSTMEQNRFFPASRRRTTPRSCAAHSGSPAAASDGA